MKIFLVYLKSLAIFTTMSILCGIICIAEAHPRHTNSLMAELNDYIPALQKLKESDAEAEKLFTLLLNVRQRSWDIRKNIDDNDLRNDSAEIVNAVKTAKDERAKLLKACKEYFASQEGKLSTAVVTVNENNVDIDWDDSVIPVEQWSRKIVLIAIKNNCSGDAHITMKSDSDRQILFWQKDITLDVKDVRYTFAYIAPTVTGKIKSNIYILKDKSPQGEFTLNALSVEPASEIQDEKLFIKSIKIQVRDAETSQPLAVRVKVGDDNKGTAYWTPLKGTAYGVNQEKNGFHTRLWDFQPGPYFYMDGYAELGVAANNKTIRIYHGYEYIPIEMQVPANGVVDVIMHRWVDMASKGWYSGHTHIHTTDIGMPVQYSHFWPIVARAEDLKVTNILTLKGEKPDPIYANEYPMGIVPWASSDKYIITYGQEYRSNPYGHLCFLGIDKLVEPISSGALGELAGPDYPPNAFAIDEAKDQGGTIVGAHFGIRIMDSTAIASGYWPSTSYEMPVDVALGKINIAEIWGAGGQISVWYKLLNCGFNINATAGPDWSAKDTPRVYVYLGNKRFTLDNWLKGLEEGKSFITYGPMLSFTVDGNLPGSNLNYESYPKTIHVKASALMPGKFVPVEIIINSQVVAKGLDIDQDIVLEESSWIAARCDGGHSSPVYVTLGGRERGSSKDAQEFIKVIDRLKYWVITKGLFDTPQQKQTVLDLIQRGRKIYESIGG